MNHMHFYATWIRSRDIALWTRKLYASKQTNTAKKTSATYRKTDTECERKEHEKRYVILLYRHHNGWAGVYFLCAKWIFMSFKKGKKKKKISPKTKRAGLNVYQAKEEEEDDETM